MRSFFHFYRVKTNHLVMGLTLLTIFLAGVFKDFKDDLFSSIEDGKDATVEYIAGIKSNYLHPLSDEQKAALSEFEKKYANYSKDRSSLLWLIPEHGAKIHISDGSSSADYIHYMFPDSGGHHVFDHDNKVKMWEISKYYSYYVTLPDFYIEFDHFLNVIDIKKL